MGLGDALYVQSIVRHLIEKGESLKVHTAWPDVFRQLGRKVEILPFSRQVNILAHYSSRKGKTDTTQFEDVVLQSGLKPPVDLRLDWQVEDDELVRKLKETANGRPILCVQLPRSPMGRKDGFGAELLPDCRVIQRAIDMLRERALVVQIGAGRALYTLERIEVDLSNKTSVGQLLDVASVADGFLGYVSFLVPLAESFSKPALLVWSHRGLKAGHAYIRQITPQKVLFRKSSVYVFDDWPAVKIQGVVDAFMR